MLLLDNLLQYPILPGDPRYKYKKDPWKSRQTLPENNLPLQVKSLFTQKPQVLLP
jgi:hypothetical protein